ncbi:MAG: hypothetical protein GXP47_11235, partial [Acidobacteria bacterium]|nr:hypothetical protein [Acidobacteriota bacterium]
FRFDVARGQTVNVALTSLPADYDMYLYDPAGNLVEQSASGGTANEQIAHTATMTGPYRVRVFGYQGAYDAADAYALDVTLSGQRSKKTYIPLIRSEK